MSPKKILRIVASLGLVALVVWLVGPTRVGAAFAAASPVWLAAGLLSSALATLLSALRWHSLAAWLGLASPRRNLILAYWRGVTANSILPGATLGGDTLRALHLHQSGHSLFPATVSVILDRFSGLWVLVTLSLAVSALALAGGLLPSAQLPLSLAALTLFALLALTSPILAWQISSRIARQLPPRIATLLDTVHGCPQPFAQFLRQLVWSALVQLASILAFACGGWAVGLDLPFWQFLIAAGPIFVFAALPVSVGGWGTREAAAALTLGMLGAPQELAVATAVLYGMFATVQGILGALTLIKPNPKR